MLKSNYSEKNFVKAIYTDSVDEVINKWELLSDEILASTDELSKASLIFYVVQRKNDTEAVQLLSYLCDERKCCDCNYYDTNGQTALFFAARDGNIECVRYLLDMKCDFNHLDTAGQTAIFYAAREGKNDVIELLYDYGCDLNIRDKIGQTAFFYAAREGHLECVKLLMNLGAVYNLRDNHRKTAYFYASKRGFNDVATYLLNAINQNSDKQKHPYILEKQLKIDGVSTWIIANEDEQNEFCSMLGIENIWNSCLDSVFFRLSNFLNSWCKPAIEIINHLCNDEDGYWFARKVDVVNFNCPDYYTIIKRPIDFSMIRRNLKNKAYHYINEFREDVEQVFINCEHYNAKSTVVYASGVKIKKLFNELWNKYNFDNYVMQERYFLGTGA